jgi:hypothetical protein
MRVNVVEIVPPYPDQKGPPAYAEVVETVLWGLRELLGVDAVTRTVNEFKKGVGNVVFGVQMLPEESIDTLPEDTVVYNLEQLRGLEPEQIRGVYHRAAARLQFWDYNLDNLHALRRLKLRLEPRHVPIGWAKALERIARPAAQDLDVLFYGHPSNERLQVLVELAKTTMRCAFLTGVFGPTRDEIIGRSKVVLNLRGYQPNRVFEVVRVSYLLANAKAVVASDHPDTSVEPDIRDAVAFTPVDQIVQRCRRLVENDEERHALEQRGRAVIRRRDIRNILSAAL